MSQQISAIERLLSLPPLFRGSDLTIRFQWTSKAASQYLYLWKKRGLIQALGGHSDVFANLLKSPTPNWDHALLRAMPSAVIVGVEALRTAGWTTQIQHRPSVAVDKSQAVFSVDYFDVCPLPSSWFAKVKPGLQRHQENIPVLKPAWALADMLSREGWGACGLDPDDIEWDIITAQDEADWEKACQAFGMTKTALLNLEGAPA